VNECLAQNYSEELFAEHMVAQGFPKPKPKEKSLLEKLSSGLW
jgi:hypothetical protein